MHPYHDIPPKSRWKDAVAARSPFDVSDLWDPKFPIAQGTPVVTFGAGVAQQFARALTARGMAWFDAEPAPRIVSKRLAQQFGYRRFSARTAAIDTPSLLLQWLRWAFAEAAIPGEVWIKGERFIDPFRPQIEPDGFASPETVTRMRDLTLAALRDCVTKSEVFVFALGQTESWFHRDGYEYPICPGTAGGTFDRDRHIFVNQRFSQVHAALGEAITLMRRHNPQIRILLTVSPAPLIATNSGDHILVATTQSKSILRAAAAELSAAQAFVDYFPGYEIVSAPTFRGMFLEPDQQSISPAGVDFIMRCFFDAQERMFGMHR
ncbi:MAG: GSCFA domain-containing protein [Rhodobacter sp.]|nr:GSCFA domain-containing protein [Paracoccaceae bacterium]MCC0078109.1 GSCFA domain-containing protein [Rhodobacter sp.]